MSKLSLIIGNKNYSSWSLRPWLVMRKLGLDFDEIHINLADPEFKADILSAGKLGGKRGLVPVLLDGENSIWDSLAICEYLADDHPSLWPSQKKNRALARSMVSEMHSGFIHLRSALPMNCRANKRKITIDENVKKDIDRVQQLWSLAQSQSTDEGPWLFGSFSIVDAFYAPVVIRFAGYDVPLNKAAQDYIKAWYADPELQEWISAGKAESEVMSAYEQGEP